MPIINEMYGSTNDPYPADQRSPVRQLPARPNKLLWMYQSCEPSSSCSNAAPWAAHPGWPTMFIDETGAHQPDDAVDGLQVPGDRRALLRHDVRDEHASDAWTTQYEFGNNGDGSIWYPGKPSVIGGTHDIPIESIRMKMLREGMQDYEYLQPARRARRRGLRADRARQRGHERGQLRERSRDFGAGARADGRRDRADDVDERNVRRGRGSPSPEPGPETSDEGGVGDNEPDNNGSGCNCDAGAMGTTSVPAGFAVLALLMRRRARPRPR